MSKRIATQMDLMFESFLRERECGNIIVKNEYGDSIPITSVSRLEVSTRLEQMAREEVLQKLP